MDRSKKPSTYDRYAEDAAQVFYEMKLKPGYEALDFYRQPDKLSTYISMNPNTVRVSDIFPNGASAAA
jgi:hypothetical protein